MLEGRAERRKGQLMIVGRIGRDGNAAVERKVLWSVEGRERKLWSMGGTGWDGCGAVECGERGGCGVEGEGRGGCDVWKGRERAVKCGRDSKGWMYSEGKGRAAVKCGRELGGMAVKCGGKGRRGCEV
ncbi:hypothetical protein E2C01_100395 [Portunus trituberculatus]|uniref:Uncharacterized protein n=1 Tax=Portunus trituberculatus TaxID=210409 RepID=A0A5B7K2X3_PORTR|nr:hypothetical protein [Portunus trituberculatus]